MNELLVNQVDILDGKTQYAYIVHSDAQEDAISLRVLAPTEYESGRTSLFSTDNEETETLRITRRR